MTGGLPVASHLRKHQAAPLVPANHLTPAHLPLGLFWAQIDNLSFDNPAYLSSAFLHNEVHLACVYYLLHNFRPNILFGNQVQSSGLFSTRRVTRRVGREPGVAAERSPPVGPRWGRRMLEGCQSSATPRGSAGDYWIGDPGVLLRSTAGYYLASL